MSGKAKYCYILNTYTISGCNNCDCDIDGMYSHWAQGIGDISAKKTIKIELVDIFDDTFDNTFN